MLLISGLREDGRKSDEVRSLQCNFDNPSAFTDPALPVSGYCKLSQGLTTVVASVFGPKAAGKKESRDDRPVLKCTVTFANFSSSERKMRIAGDRKSKLLALTIEEAFSRVVCPAQLERTEIAIDLKVEEADGSILAVLINATTLALINAGIPLIDLVTACSVGIIDSATVLDLTHNEQSQSKATTLVVAVLSQSFHIDVYDKKDDHGDNRILLVKTISNGSYNRAGRLSLETLDRLTLKAIQGCQKLTSSFKANILEFTSDSLQQRNFNY